MEGADVSEWGPRDSFIFDKISVFGNIHKDIIAIAFILMSLTYSMKHI